MMKILKASVSLFLAFILALSVTAAAFAEEDAGKVVLSGTAGEGITWTLTDKGLLTVSGSGPIQDDIDYEYDDDGEVSSWTLNRSIGMSVYDYMDSLIAEVGVEETAEIELNIVKEIVIEEGITAVPEGEFNSFYPRKITLPSPLEKIGYNAINAMYAEELIIPTDKIDVFQFSIPAYRDGAEPYESLFDAKEGYIERRVDEEIFIMNSTPLNVLREIYAIRNGIFEYDEEELAMALDNFNEELGTDFDSIDGVAAYALEKVNDYFGTEYTNIDDMFIVINDEDAV